MFSEKSIIFQIYEIKDLNGNKILNPFSRKVFGINLVKRDFEDELKRLKYGDNVIFTFKAKYLEKESFSPIDVYEDSIKKIDDIKSITLLSSLL